MLRLFGDHTLVSALKRLGHLLRNVGLLKTAAIFISILDDQYLKLFDRKYRIKTSGFIPLAATSFTAARLPDATIYGPVNGWALRRCLRRLGLSRELQFVDLGCGLGRPCIIAAEYGFNKVTGIELAPELCAGARENVARCRLAPEQRSSIEILEMDALDFCEHADADVFFMFRPFSWEFLRKILEKLAARASEQGKMLTIIYSERMAHSVSYANAISQSGGVRLREEYGAMGQAFYIYGCTGRVQQGGPQRTEEPQPKEPQPAKSQ